MRVVGGVGGAFKKRYLRKRFRCVMVGLADRPCGEGAAGLLHMESDLSCVGISVHIGAG